VAFAAALLEIFDNLVLGRASGGDEFLHLFTRYAECLQIGNTRFRPGVGTWIPIVDPGQAEPPIPPPQRNNLVPATYK